MEFKVEWETTALEHIARHGIELKDVRALIDRKDLYVRKSGERFTMIGRTDGRILFLFLARVEGVRDLFRIVTCRPADASERHLSRRRRKGYQ